MAAPLPVGPLPYGVVAAAGRDVRAVARTYRPRQPLPRPQRPPPKGAAVRLDADLPRLQQHEPNSDQQCEHDKRGQMPAPLRL